MERALDSWKERTGVKTHFVLVRYNGFEFEIQTRQHDGITGQASLFTGQVVRMERTRDREFVARTAALLLARDFGLIGTVQGAPANDGTVTVAIKGGGLGAPLGPWVKKDEVFGLVGMSADNQEGTVFPWVLLRVEKPPAEGSRDGLCVCRLYYRQGNPFSAGNFAGFRCVKLGTTRGPVRLRLAAEGTSAGEPVVVQVRRFGFQAEEGTKLSEDKQVGAVFDTAGKGEEGSYDHMAFVSIMASNQVTPRVPRLPFPILTDQPLPVKVPPVGSSSGSLGHYQVNRWTREVTDSYLVQTSLFKRLEEMMIKPELRLAALKEAQTGLERSRRDHKRLKKEREALEKELPATNRPNLAAWDQRLKQMKDNEIQIVNFITKIEQIERKANDPDQQKLLAEIERARLKEENLEYGEAIEILMKVQRGGIDTPEVKAKLAELQKVWDTHNDQKFADARAFIYHTWPTLDTPGLKARLEEARTMFAECKRVRDRLGPDKLLRETLVHGQRLAKELETLNPRLNPDDEPKAKLIGDLGPELEKLSQDVLAYLKSIGAAK